MSGEVGAGYATAAYNCCTALIWLLLISEQVFEIVNDASVKLAIDTVQLNQVIQDWETVPFTDIRITDDWTCHDLDHPQQDLAPEDQGEWSEVFARVWYGLDYGCNCVDVWLPSHYKMDDVNGKFNPGVSCTQKMVLVGCGNVEPYPPIF